MAIEAPLSKYKKHTYIGIIVVLIAFAVYCVYDGYYNEKFIEKHKDASGNPDSTLLFNQKSPAYFIGGAVLLGIYLLAIRNRRVVADAKELIINDKERIPYEAIQKIDKTYFRSKGFFVVTYKKDTGHEAKRKLSDRTYDNLGPLLDELVAKIS